MNEQFINDLSKELAKLGTIHSVGEEWISYTGKIPSGGIPYCGQEVTRETYSALWSWVQAQGLVKTESEWQSIASSQNGNVPFYSSGNGTTTFRMPKLVGYVKGASSKAESGDYIAEGLPNITGNGWNQHGASASDWSGAFYADKPIGRVNVATGSAIGEGYLYFDASRSNTIYGNSNHVTPETSVVLFGVYAFGALCNVDDLDVTTLATAVARLEANLDGHIASDVAIGGDFSDLASTRGQIGDSVYGEYDGVDLNTFTKSGVYAVRATTETAIGLNFPSNGGMNGWLVVHAMTNGRCRQIYYRMGTVGTSDRYVATRTLDVNTASYGTWRPFTSFSSVINKGTIKSGTVSVDTIVMIHSPQPQDFYINGNYWGEVNNYHGDYKTGVTLALPAGSSWSVDHTTDHVWYVEVN